MYLIPPRVTSLLAAATVSGLLLVGGCSSADTPAEATADQPGGEETSLVPTSSGWETTGANALDAAADGVGLHECPGEAEEDYEGWSTIWGDQTYSDDTWVCLAAIHAGVITRTGGLVAVSAAAGQDSYPAVARHGVESNSLGAWERSFTVSVPESAVPADPPAANDDAATSAQADDPCSLLTVAEIGAEVGVAFGAGQREEAASSDAISCFWNNAAGKSLPTAMVQVDPDTSQAAAQRSVVTSGLGGATDVEIPGASDAYTFLHGESLHMIVGDQFVVMNVAGIDAPDGTPVLTALAKLVAERL